MNFRAILIVIFLVVVSGGLMVHFRMQSIVDESSKPTKDDGIPKPAAAGPYGKFVVVGGETEHDFGVMEFGQKGSHEFKIRNDGPGPLKMVARKEDHTCQCTLGSLGSDGLKPGEETTVTLNWEIKNPSPNFHHTAKIRTDDPDNPVTTFHVRGIVGRRLALTSGNEINIGTLSEKTPTERKFTIFSETVDSFEITKLEPSVPLIEVTSRSQTRDELEEATADPATIANARMIEEARKAEKQHLTEKRNSESKEGPAPPPLVPPEDAAPSRPPVRCGYELKVVFQPKFPIGKFRESLTIHTNLPDTPPTVVVFEGNRAGPVQILGTPGLAWSPEDSILKLPRFRAQEGKKAKLMVFIKKTDAPWNVTDISVNPPFLKTDFVKDEKFQGTGRDRFDLLIEVPAGEASVDYTGERIGSVILNTTHPEAKVIKIGVDFTSY